MVPAVPTSGKICDGGKQGTQGKRVFWSRARWHLVDGTRAGLWKEQSTVAQGPLTCDEHNFQGSTDI